MYVVETIKNKNGPSPLICYIFTWRSMWSGTERMHTHF